MSSPDEQRQGSAEGQSTRGNQAPVAAWLSRNPTISSQLMFHLGRHFNCFNFHLMQAFVLYGVDLRADANQQLAFSQELLEQLHAFARLLNVGADVALADSFHKIRMSIHHGFDSPGHRDQLNHLQRKLRECGDEYSDYYWRRGLVENAVPVMYTTRETLKRHLDECQVAYFELGELLDEGIRPKNVFERMYDSAKHMKAFARLEDDPTFDSSQIEGDGRANTSRRPGELMPEEHWYTGLRSLFQTTFDGELLSFDSTEPKSIENIIEFVDRVDRDVRERLVAAKPTLQADVIHGTVRDLQGELHHLDLLLVKYVRALIEANGQWVGPKDLKKLSGLENFRPDREKRKLPKPILDLIELAPRHGSRLKQIALA